MNNFCFRALCLVTAGSLLIDNPAGTAAAYHYLMVALALMWLVGLVLGRIHRAEWALIAFSGMMILNSFLSRRTFGVQPRFSEDALKLTLLIAVTGFVIRYLDARRATILAIVASSAITADCLVAFALGEQDYSYGGRLGFSDWGSPNSTSFMMALCLLGWGFAYRQGWGPKWLKWVFLVSALPTLYVMHLMDSRGGMMVLAVGLVGSWALGSTAAQGMVASTRGAVILVAGFLGLGVLSTIDMGGRYSLTSSTIDSGRFQIWQHLWAQLSESTQAQIYGFGLGAIQFKMAHLLYESAHSVFLSMLFYFGFTGLAIFVCLWLTQVVRACRAVDNMASIRVAWTAGMTASFCVDNVVLAAQVLLPFGLALGAVLSELHVPSNQRGSTKATAESSQTRIVGLSDSRVELAKTSPVVLEPEKTKV